MSKEIVKSRGLGLCSFLFLIFLTLKLANVGAVAKWSWFAVFAPLWIPLALVFIAIFILLILKKIVE